MNSKNTYISTENPPKPTLLISKWAFCWLALITGVVGGHWLYQGNTGRGVLYMLLLPLAPFLGWADCMRFGLMPDEQFNARFNPDHPQDTKQTTGIVVTAVILALALFFTALMSVLAVLFQLMLAGMIA